MTRANLWLKSLCASALAALLPLASNAEISRPRAIVLAAPYVTAALTQPMPDLYAAAMKGKAKNALNLGLAMFAGREVPPGPDQAADADALAALEARILPISDAYLEAHPNSNFRGVNWRLIVKITKPEIAFVRHYEQLHSADFWLTESSADSTTIQATTPGRPSGFTGFEGTRGAFQNQTYVQPAIDTPVFLTAAQCVRAVRLAAGKAYGGPRTLPTSIILLRLYPLSDLDDMLQANGNHPVVNETTGAEACGTTEQFNTYVAQLKAAS